MILQIVNFHRVGARQLFGNPGTTDLPLNDALVHDRSFQYVLGLDTGKPQMDLSE